MALTGTALPQTKGGKSSGASGSVYEQLNLFGEAFERIRNDAVEPVGDSKLVRTAISGMLSGLDPRSVYLTEAEYKALQSKAPEDSAVDRAGADDGQQHRQGRVAARRIARRRGRHQARRSDLQYRQGADLRHDPAGDRAEAARGGRQRGHADGAARQRQAVRGQGQAGLAGERSRLSRSGSNRAISAMSGWPRSMPGRPTRWPPRSRICERRPATSWSGSSSICATTPAAASTTR